MGKAAHGGVWGGPSNRHWGQTHIWGHSIWRSHQFSQRNDSFRNDPLFRSSIICKLPKIATFGCESLAHLGSFERGQRRQVGVKIFPFFRQNAVFCSCRRKDKREENKEKQINEEIRKSDKEEEEEEGLKRETPSNPICPNLIKNFSKSACIQT